MSYCFNYKSKSYTIFSCMNKIIISRATSNLNCVYSALRIGGSSPMCGAFPYSLDSAIGIGGLKRGQ